MKVIFGITLTILLLSLISPIDATPNKLKPPKPDAFCKALGGRDSDGSQIKTGACSSLVQGQLPAIEHMTSSLILQPKNEQVLNAGTNFKVAVKINHLNTGHFSNPDKEYYLLPQALDDGTIKGHAHIVVQSLGSEDDAPDAREFSFFKGLNEAADKGVLSVVVDEKLSPGRYRICSMSSSESHQPVIMPVAKRGSQDDCIRVTVKSSRNRKHSKAKRP
ncbi:20761_t:CDS:1 [Cetraspora pellucida]|uniref:20761_t:CDS:1 n=1 Tax=Cetraspora pellucida TaxID=1433469 RepID=A0A9N8YWF8_9GLOM|nr:20761_t:CDS:1 [Cetraspora pellucida]